MSDDAHALSDAVPEPSFRVAFRIERDCLRAEVTGLIDDLQATVTLLLEIAAEVRRVRAKKLLVVDQTGGLMPADHEYKQMVAAVEGKGFARVRTAYVNPRATKVTRIEVGELIAREHGYQYRVFDDEQRGRIWLNYGGD